MSQRTEQVASTLKRATQMVLSRGISDPRVQGIITITRVDVSADLANATLFCTVTPHRHEKLSLHGLTSASRWIRRQVADKVRFRRMPQFSFKLDEQLIKQQEVLASIAEAIREDEKKAQNKKKDT
ncbi:MAG: 30S ribosome-binding factor RbfA [Phycisphaerae bacterium]|jgi:ribosome-binding factor A|nr:30S ribosome-binding factor RbfA [Phycisphaerae bacterium]MBT6165061.1 30S ribosome-binding factor RbfA [Phycisphaerae bacterium]MBT7657536.1 30S ribosome-binding factor RbfA [Phycisphaerae bacterium]